MRSPLNIASTVTKYMTVIAIGLLTVNAEDSKAQEWERFYARINSAKQRVNWDGSLRVESGVDGLWFKSDGRYADTDEGVGTARNFDAYCYDAPKRCGNFRYENGRYILWNNSYPDRQPEVYTYSRTDDTLRDGKVVYQYVPPVQNYRLNGNYRYAFNRIGGDIYSFNSSGQFAVRNRNTATGEVTVRAGKYTINNYSMYLQYEDGEQEIRSFYILSNLMFLDGNYYERLK